MIKTKVIFPKKQIEKQILNFVVKEQTERLIVYAMEEIKRIGDDISVAPTRNNLDRTGNLLDSLCWGVCYGGKLKKYGFYRNEVATEDSALHEWSKPTGESVNGHIKAQNFISKFKAHDNGWDVFFAVLAPYWGYWEHGFVLKHSGSFRQWAVMTRHYDTVKRDLSPSEVTFTNHVPKY